MGIVTKTLVMNLMDDRKKVYELPAERAVVVAYEQFEKGNRTLVNYHDPSTHPRFEEHRLGFACGDWIAYKDPRPEVAA